MSIHLDSTGMATHGRLQPDTAVAITTVLRDIEAATHRYGWDQQPVLFGLFDHVTADGTAAVEADPSIAEPDVWSTPDPHRHGMTLPVPVVLHRLATDLTSPAARRWWDAWLHAHGRTCIGIGMAFEAWTAPIRPGYRYGDLAKAPTGLRREVRVVAAVDTDLHLHRVIRVRGASTPRVAPRVPLPARSRHRSIVTGLHRLARIARSL
ncbi:hypothetical protein [Micromonospora sp. WMMD1082]|uniref:hypothetical protein n=1 Tax=Micromonospora sp. WMMD1082 TaxID=3016104 RepID=UPI0024162C57|nr:hypothetical protein [Micromonospora sp. WMMD1082]MDG4795023.1 hypothetical protein [Micromonospora sp. WMMD1082]